MAKQLLETGDDTQFVNMTRAYEDLPLDIKKRIDRRKAKHVSQSKFSAQKLTGLTPEAKKHVPDFVMHPLVRTRPETGRETLYVNQIRIEGTEVLEEAETLELLDALIDHATQTKYQYRHKWRLNDLVIWQSRCLLHQANGDYNFSQTGYLYRVMPQGDAPY